MKNLLEILNKKYSSEINILYIEPDKDLKLIDILSNLYNNISINIITNDEHVLINSKDNCNIVVCDPTNYRSMKLLYQNQGFDYIIDYRYTDWKVKINLYNFLFDILKNDGFYIFSTNSEDFKNIILKNDKFTVGKYQDKNGNVEEFIIYCK